MSIKLDKQIILKELKLISSIDSLEALRIKYLGKKKVNFFRDEILILFNN